MLKKGNILYSMFFGKCPKCHEESMYVEKNSYKLATTLKMNKKCSSCGQRYHIEPGFFDGAMYVSYALGIAFSVAAFVLANLFFTPTVWQTFGIITLTMIVLMPLMARMARSIWINMFVHYDKNAVQKYKESQKNNFR